MNIQRPAEDVCSRLRSTTAPLVRTHENKKQLYVKKCCRDVIQGSVEDVCSLSWLTPCAMVRAHEKTNKMHINFARVGWASRDRMMFPSLVINAATLMREDSMKEIINRYKEMS